MSSIMKQFKENRRRAKETLAITKILKANNFDFKKIERFSN